MGEGDNEHQMSRHDAAWGSAVGACRVEAPVADQFQFRSNPGPVGGRTRFSSLGVMHPVNWPGNGSPRPGHFYPFARAVPRCGSLGGRRLGRSHARPSRHHQFSRSPFGCARGVSKHQACKLTNASERHILERLSYRSVADEGNPSERGIHAAGSITQGLGNV